METVTNEMLIKSQIRAACEKALASIYICVDQEIADDLNIAVRRYTDALLAQVGRLKEENSKLAEACRAALERWGNFADRLPAGDPIEDKLRAALPKEGQ